MVSGQDDIDPWKNKYLESVELFDKKSTRMTEMIKQLRQGMSRISVAANGLDYNLDRQLNALRREIRNGTEHKIIQQHIAAICKTLRTLDEGRNEQSNLLIDSIHKLLGPIDGMDLPQKVIHDISQLKKDIEIDPPSKPIDEILLTFQRVYFEVMNVLRSGRASAGNDKTIAPTKKEKSSIWGKLTSAKLSEDEHDHESVSDTISDALLQLLDHLAIPEQLEDKGDGIRARIQQGIEYHDLDHVVEDITSLVIDAFDADQEKFESFLTDLNSRLEHVQTFLSDTCNSDEAAVDESNTFHTAVQHEISQIQTSICEADNIETLSQSISTHLDSITGTLNEYQQYEKQRVEHSLEKINVLEKQLHETEKHADDLRTEMTQQRHRSQKDPLTGLPNRVVYNDVISEAYKQWKKEQVDLVIAVGDIDHFKEINDSYGHLAGDKVLKKIADVLQGSMRKADLICRYGGEEFVFILEKTNADNAVKVMEKLRDAIASCGFHFRGNRVQITMSFGVTQFTKDDNQPDDGFARADKALYKAKQEGRNKVCKL